MKTNESGRSMVEMLGVLAIIGVLSIGGIAGYTTAMNRYRANEVIDMATKYATVAYTSFQTYGARHHGNGMPSGNMPSLVQTGLDDDGKINGATIETAVVTKNDGTQQGSTEAAPGTASDYNKVRILIKFKDGDSSNVNVCKAAASALGYTGGTIGNKHSIGVSNCAEADPQILFVTKHS